MDAAMRKGAQQGLLNMLGLKKDEIVTILTDNKSIAQTDNAFVDVAREIVGDSMVVSFNLDNLGARPLQLLPSSITEQAARSDVTMFVAESYDGELETVRRPFVIAAKGGGARHGHCPGFTRNMMTQGMAADYNVVYALSRALFETLSNSSRITVASEAGTNLVVETQPSRFPWQPSKPVVAGQMANLPDGEIFCFPSDVYGTAVVDGCVGDFLGEKYGFIGKSPVYIDIQGGMAVNIKCPENRRLESDLRDYVLNRDGKREFLTRRVAEFALGTNLDVVDITGKLLQDEKSGIACHFAFGDPLDHEGTGAGYVCKGHLDNLIMRPTVRVDGKIIMNKGQYVADVIMDTLRHLPSSYSLASDGLSFVTSE